MRTLFNPVINVVNKYELLFCLFFEIGFLYVTLAVLELAP